MGGADGAEKMLRGLPERVRSRLEELREALREALGDDLVSLLVFGSAVRGGYRSDQSDVDVLVVLRDDAPEKLVAIGPALQLARYAARIEAIVLKADEIPRAADVFPLLYDDVRRRHAVLAGRDPFAGLTISDVHLRLRVEQELREARIRLRRAIADAPQPAALVGPIERKIKQIRGALHALLRLRGEGGEDDGLEAVLRAACAAYGVDAGPLRDVARDPRAACLAIARLLDAAIQDVDEREEARGGGGA